MKYQARTQGFTLIELMIVIVVIAILAVIAYPSFQQFIERSRLENARSLMNDNIRMMEQHYGQHRTFCVGAALPNGECDIGKTPTLKGDPDSGYAIELKQTKSSSYLMIATPLNASHNSDEKKLYLVYSSVSGTFSRCTEAGKDDSLNSADGTLMLNDDDCEVF